MALLNRMIRNTAITGRTDNIRALVSGRQSGRWAEQTILASSFPAAAGAMRPPPEDPARAPADPAETLRELTELHQHGVLTDAEFEHLRTGLND